MPGLSPGETIELAIPVTLLSPGDAAILVALPGDELVGDDRAACVVEVHRELHVIILAEDPTRGAARSFALALDPRGGASFGQRVTRRALPGFSGDGLASALASADAVLIDSPQSVSADLRTAVDVCRRRRRPRPDPGSWHEPARSVRACCVDSQAGQSARRRPEPALEAGQHRHGFVPRPFLRRCALCRSGAHLREDNLAEADVVVGDAKRKVLLISGTSTYEFQFLRSYLLRQVSLYETTTWQQDADARFNQEASPGTKLAALPATAEALAAYDCVILVDPQEITDSVDARFAGLPDQYVARRHGGPYVAARRFTAAALAPGAPLASLVDALPVVPGHVGSGPGAPGEPLPTPLRLAATDPGHALPILRIDDDSYLRSFWSRLPGPYRVHPVARLKPGATALVIADDAVRRSEDGSPLPVLAWQHYGRGKVLWLGIDT